MNELDNVEDDFEQEPKSKSQVKRELHALQDLGSELVELPKKHLEEIPLSDKTREAIIAARSFKYGALARQLKYIGGLMPHEDVEAIQSTLKRLKQPHENEVSAFHEVEEWRDTLLKGDHNLLNDLAERFEQFDRQHVSQLMRNAGKEQKQNKAPKSARLLFKYLSELQQDKS